MGRSIKRIRKPIKYYFWKRVSLGNERGCWIWTGCKNPAGYGMISVGNNRPDRSHRVSYRLFKGEIPKDMQICHHCDIPACVNPDHLFLGTAKDNAQDKTKKGRNNAQKGEKSGAARFNNKQVLEIANSKELVRVLAKKYNVTEQAITNIRTGKFWSSVTKIKYDKIKNINKFGENHSNTTMTNKEVLDVFNYKGSNEETSIKFNIPESRVYHIKSGKTWSRVTGLFSKHNKDKQL